MTAPSSSSGPSKSEVSAAEVFRKALAKLNDKLDAGEDLPPHVLKDVMVTTARVMEKEEEPEGPRGEDLDPFASLESLPLERQRELLHGELARLESLKSEYEERLADLDGNEAP